MDLKLRWRMSRIRAYIGANTEFPKTCFLAIRDSLTDMRSKDTFRQWKFIGYWKSVREPKGWPCRECPWDRPEWKGPSAKHIRLSSLTAKDARQSISAILASSNIFYPTALLNKINARFLPCSRAG